MHNLAHFLVERGHQVTILTHKAGGLPVWVEREGPVRVIRVRIASQFDRAPGQALRCRFFDALNAVLLGPFYWLWRPQVVHCHLINVDTRYGLRLARLSGAKFVISMRGGETEHWIEGRPFRRDFVARMLRAADRVTGVAGDLLAQGERIAPGVLRKGEVIPNPADPQRIESMRRRSARKPAGRYILFAGRLEAMKDVGTLVAAYQRLSERRPDFPWRLLIAGVGSLDEQLRRQAQAGPGAGRIEFLGHVGYADTLALIDRAEAVVLPSVFSEGCPNVILEAMTLETPVIVSSLPALSELVEHGEDGLVFEMGDAEGLSGWIEQLADDPSIRSKLTRKARARIEDRHSPQKLLERIERIYSEGC